MEIIYLMIILIILKIIVKIIIYIYINIPILSQSRRDIKNIICNIDVCNNEQIN